MKIALKELRKTQTGMKIIYQAGLIKTKDEISRELDENNELISIFVKSIQTAQNNLTKEKLDQYNQINSIK